MAGDVCERVIAVAGLAFKGGTDDIRESPAVVLVQALLTRGALVKVHDAHAKRRLKAVLGDRVTYAAGVYEACDGAQALVIANDDRAYARLDWQRVAQALDGKSIIDLRNRLDPNAVRSARLDYAGVGRAAAKVRAS
jgi:UDPglucose 6-dehydrogenase